MRTLKNSKIELFLKQPVVLFLLLSSSLWAKDYTTFLPDKRNPATYAFTNSIFTRFSYHKYTLDLPEIQKGELDIAIPSGMLGVFILSGEFLSMSPYQENRLTTGLAKNISLGRRWSLPLAAELSFNRIQYDRSQFHSFDPEDPIFKTDLSQQDFGANVSLMCNSPYVSAGISVTNLLQPNLSVINSPGGKLDRIYSFNLLFPFTKTLHLYTSFSHQNWSGSEITFSPHLRIMDNLLLEPQLVADQELNPSSVNLGLNILWNRFLFYYNFALLTSTGFKDIDATNHRVSIAYRFPPTPHLPDLKPWLLFPLPEVISISESLDLALAIENIGDTVMYPPCSVNVSVFHQDTLEKIFAFPVNKTVPPDSQIELETSFVFHNHGRRKLVIEIDRDNIIEEGKEDNNLLHHLVDVVPTPSGELLVGDITLDLKRLTYIVEECPLVPTIFFPPGSYDIPQRMNRTLKEIAERLRENPVAKLVLTGYVDSRTDPSDWEKKHLHINRAETVKEALISYGAPENQIVVQESGYNPTTPRISVDKAVKYARDIPLLSQENRRVEITTRLPELPATLLPDSVEPSYITDLLQQNPHLLFIIQGYANPDSPYTTLGQMHSLKQRLVKQPQYIPRLPILPNFEHPEPIHIVPTAEAILYKPTRRKITQPVWINETPETTTIELDFFSPFPIDTYRVEVVDTAGTVVRDLVAGSGDTPSSVKWDWKDNSGNVLTPENSYLVRMYYKDSVGQSGYIWSDTLTVKVQKRIVTKRKLVIVEFTFDEVSSISAYLESRLDEIASDLVERIKQEPSVERKITFLGHTDIIGDPERNRVLSEDRALKEANLLRILMTSKLGLESSEQFFEWLKEHNCEWDALGLASSEPFAILTHTGEEKILGENQLPEGRVMNRRVVLEIKAYKL